MRFKSFIRALAAIASLALIIIAVFGTQPLKLIPFLGDAAPRNSLTNLEGDDGPVLVVKIDDTSNAHPQVGLESADVVYIEQVEGGLTRLAAVFSSKIPATVGPVRSARISDIELFAQYGKVAFAYSGAQQKMLPVIASANLHDAGATHYGPTYYSNDVNRIAPYAMMLNASALMEKVLSSDSTIVTSKPMGWTFGDLAQPGSTFTSVHLSWPAASYDIKWSEPEHRWLLNHNGVSDVNDQGYQLGPKTFVIQMVSVTDSIYHDKVGGVTPLIATVGEGDCYILRDGLAISGHWSRSATDSGTTFTTAAGDEIPFDSGQIWFALLSKSPIFQGLTAQDATGASTK